MATLLQDVRYALRVLRKSPGFTAVAILTLALGIGANTAIFSVVNSIVLRPLPFPQPNQLVFISEMPSNTSVGLESYMNFLDWQRNAKSFSSLAAYQYSQMTLTGHGAPTLIQGAITSSSLFRTLEIAPLLGRTLESRDDVKGAARVVVIGEGFWRGQLGADPHIIGKIIQLDSEPFAVVGVMPAVFRYPDQTPPSQFWVPVGQSPDDISIIDKRATRFLYTIGRLKRGTTASEAQAEMTVIVKRTSEQYIAVTTVQVASLRRLIFGNLQNVLLIFLGAVGLVLLIACANVANLLLVRATGRAKEIAVRVALGAGRIRIFRQLLTESVMLGVCAGAAGLLLAYWGVAAIKSLAADQLPHVNSIHVDGWVLAFTFALSVFVGVLFGLAPAWQSSEIDLNEALREGGGSIGTAKRSWARNTFVAVEVALSVMLLIGSGLLLKSFYLLTRTNPGFDPQHALTGDVTLPQSQYVKPEQWSAFFRQATQRLKSLPGVEDASAAVPIPFSGGIMGRGFLVVGAPHLPPDQEPPSALTHSVTIDYFQVLRIPLIWGREFTESDTAPDAARVIIISEDLARRYFGHNDPIGQSLLVAGGAGAGSIRRIVGVVGDVKNNALDEAFKPTIYFPFTQEPQQNMSFVVRTKGDPVALTSAVQATIHDLDSSLPVDVSTLTSMISDSEGDARFRSTLLGLFGILALVLASVGIYSVLAYVVSQRNHEIGVRMALGAQPGQVMRLILSVGLRLTLIGVAIGIAASLALTRLISSLLFGISATDPATFAGVTVLLVVVALAACYIPARRAMRVDPMVALRHE